LPTRTEGHAIDVGGDGSLNPFEPVLNEFIQPRIDRSAPQGSMSLLGWLSSV
jgi:hypothetical protein